MPLTYTILPTRRLVIVEYHGGSTFGDWAANMESVFADAAFKPGFAFVFDRRNAPAPTANFVDDSMKFLKTHEAKLGRGFRWAVVVGDELSYGMASMLQEMSGFAEMRVVRSLQEAEEWVRPGS